MQQREKYLALGLAGLFGLLLLWFVYDGVSAAFAQRDAELASLEKTLRGKEAQLKLAAEQSKRLKTLEQQSLPTDRQIATSKYQHWLGSIAEKSKLAKPSFKQPAAATVRDGGFDKLSFSFTADGTLENITKFLHEFYQADHLHKIQSLSLKVSDASSNLMQFQVSVEALVLSTANRSDALNVGESKRLAESDFAKYKEAIVGRNLFAAYKPPPPPTPPRVERVVDTPPPPPKPPEFDPAAVAKLTSILASGVDAEAWILVQTTGKTLRLHVGDTFEVGSVKGQITGIEVDRIEVNLNGARKTVLLGESLRDAASAIPTSTVSPADPQSAQDARQ